MDPRALCAHLPSTNTIFADLRPSSLCPNVSNASDVDGQEQYHPSHTTTRCVTVHKAYTALSLLVRPTLTHPPATRTHSLPVPPPQRHMPPSTAPHATPHSSTCHPPPPPPRTGTACPHRGRHAPPPGWRRSAAMSTPTPQAAAYCPSHALNHRPVEPQSKGSFSHSAVDTAAMPHTQTQTRDSHSPHAAC